MYTGSYEFGDQYCRNTIRVCSLLMISTLCMIFNNSLWSICRYPEGEFSCHSTRSGFLCSAIMKSNGKSSLQNIYADSAVVAGWNAVGSRAMMGYVRQEAQMGLIGSRLVGLGAMAVNFTDDAEGLRLVGTGAVGENRLNPFLFHSLKRDPATAVDWPQSTALEVFNSRIREKVIEALEGRTLEEEPMGCLMGSVFFHTKLKLLKEWGIARPHYEKYESYRIGFLALFHRTSDSSQGS